MEAWEASRGADACRRCALLPSSLSLSASLSDPPFCLPPPPVPGSVCRRSDLWCFVYHWPWSLLWNAIGWNHAVWVLLPPSLPLSLFLSLSPLLSTKEDTRQGALSDVAFYLFFFDSLIHVVVIFVCIWIIKWHIVPCTSGWLTALTAEEFACPSLCLFLPLFCLFNKIIDW